MQICGSTTLTTAVDKCQIKHRMQIRAKLFLLHSRQALFCGTISRADGYTYINVYVSASVRVRSSRIQLIGSCCESSQISLNFGEIRFVHPINRICVYVEFIHVRIKELSLVASFDKDVCSCPACRVGDIRRLLGLY
jgi:hypothetical protein